MVDWLIAKSVTLSKYCINKINNKTRAGRVEKIAIFHIRQAHVGNMLKTRYKRVGYAWCTSVARRCTSLKVSARFARVWAQKLFLKLGRMTYTSRISSTRATGALNTL